MSTTLALHLCMQKLEALIKDKEVNDSTLEMEIENTKNNLVRLEGLLTQKQTSEKDINLEDLEKDLLKEIYTVEDTIDTFFMKTALQKRNTSAMVRVCTLLMSKQSQRLARRMQVEIQQILKGFNDKQEQIHKSIKDKQEQLDQNKDDGGEPQIPEGQSISSKQPATQANLTDDQKSVAAGKQPMQNVKPSDSESSEKQELPKQSRAISDLLDDELEFIGREAEAEKLSQDIIISRKSGFLISVVGAAGSGKTTFVRNIYYRANVMQHFQLRAWINVSEEFPESSVSDAIEQKTKNLIIDILKQVTTIKDEEKLQLVQLEEKVRDFFFNMRFLIVFDDVRTAVMLENLKRTFPNSLNGSRLIFITRHKQIAEFMNDRRFPPLELPNLDIDQSWKLFLKKVPKTEESLIDASLKELIWKKCNGLPLAIVVLGGLLSTKDPGSWKEKVERLSSGDDPSKAILALVYQDLPSALKLCLLYLGIFPKEYVIPVRRLFRLWAAEGLLNPSLKSKTPEELVDTSIKGETPEELAKSYLDVLISRKMIVVEGWRFDGSPKTCRVPGMLYDNVFPNATDIGFFNALRNLNYQQAHIIRRVAAYVDLSDSPLDDCFDNLRSYISFNTRNSHKPSSDVDKFLTMMIGKRGFSLLTVLDLENVYKPVLSDQAIGKLIHLTYLGLRWTFLDSIPNSVGDLPNLETLDVKHTNINSLPISIWNSRKLQHLYMDEVYFNMSFKNPLGSGSLRNLLTLKGLIIGKKHLGEDRLESWVGLMKLGLTFHFKSLGQISPWISKCTKLRSLKLRSVDEFSRPSELNLASMNEHGYLSKLYLLGKLTQEIEDLQLPRNLKMVTLSVSNLTKDPMQDLGKLPQLKILRLFAESYIGKEMICEAEGFPELQVLKLWMLEKLQKWIVQEGSMPRLRELEIRRCQQLKETSGLQQLNSLKELILTNMSEEFVAKIESTMKEGIVKIIRNNLVSYNPAPVM